MPRDPMLGEKIADSLTRFIGRTIDDDLLREISAVLEQETGGIAACHVLHERTISASVDLDGECCTVTLAPGPDVVNRQRKH